MKNLIIILCVFGFIIFHPFKSTAQYDIIYKKDGSSIVCKVREIKIEIIRYTRPDIKRSPFYEIDRNEVYKIVYQNGVDDILDVEFYDSLKANKTINDTNRSIADTCKNSTLYVVFNSGNSTQSFPLYIGGEYICTLQNHSRLEYKLVSEGEKEVYRDFGNLIGPVRKINFLNCNKYAIDIQIKNEQIHDPNQRFIMAVYEGEQDVQEFLLNKYNTFKPFKTLDFHLTENGIQETK